MGFDIIEINLVCLFFKMQLRSTLGLSETSSQYHQQCLALPLTLKNLIWLAHKASLTVKEELENYNLCLNLF